MTIGENLFWDSCIFIRYLSGTAANEHYNDICQFVNEAKVGKWKVHFSTLVYAEIRPEFLKEGGFEAMTDFFSDLGASFFPIEPNPNVMIAAGQLHAAKPTDTSNPKSPVPSNRVVGTPDAIHLMTCVYARDVLGVSNITFHTTDQGRGKSWEGKCVPLVGFEKWFPNAADSRVKEVCALKRSKPIHPEPLLIDV